MKKIDAGTAEALRHGIKRSAAWPKVERAFRKAHPTCLACKPSTSSAAIQVHHVHPFHYVVAVGRPDLELDSRNLVSLCESEKGKEAANHHLLLGHLDNFKEGNLAVVADATVKYHGLSAEEIRADKEWQSEEKEGRLKALDEMTEADKKVFREMLDRKFPLK